MKIMKMCLGSPIQPVSLVYLVGGLTMRAYMGFYDSIRQSNGDFAVEYSVIQ